MRLISHQTFLSTRCGTLNIVTSFKSRRPRRLSLYRPIRI